MIRNHCQRIYFNVYIKQTFKYSVTSSYIWRSTTDNNTGLGKRSNSSEVIEFTITNISDGKHVRDTEFAWVIGFAENERPKQDFNEIQDTGPNSLTFIINGNIENPANNNVFQLLKEWLLESKQNNVFTKGRFGIELNNIKAHNVVPASTGTLLPDRPEQSRGLLLVNWNWIQSGEWPSKADFTAEFKMVGDPGNTSTNPSYDWTVLRTS